MATNHAGGHKNVDMMRTAAGDAGSTISQLRMRRWSSHQRRVVTLRAVSVPPLWLRTDNSRGTKQTADRSIKRYQKSKSTSWKISSRSPPTSTANSRRNITHVGSPIQLPLPPCNIICVTNQGPRLYWRSLQKRVCGVPHFRSHLRSSVTTRRGANASPTVGSSKHWESACKAPGSNRSSPWTNWTQSPRACSKHLLWLTLRPARDSFRISRSPGLSSRAAMAAPSSFEASSTTTISKSTPSCCRMLRRQRSIVAPLLYMGTHTETRGVLAASSRSIVVASTDTTVVASVESESAFGVIGCSVTAALAAASWASALRRAHL